MGSHILPKDRQRFGASNGRSPTMQVLTINVDSLLFLDLELIKINPSITAFGKKHCYTVQLSF